MRRVVNVAVVVLLILIGASLLFTVLYKVREPSARTRCAWNLAQIGIGLRAYGQENDALPQGTIPNAELPPGERFSWLVSIMPYAQKDGVFEKIDRDKGWAAPENQEAVNTPLRLFLCPGTFSQGGSVVAHRTNYVGMAGRGEDAAVLPADDPRAGPFGYDRRLTIEKIQANDGLGQTMLALETAWQPGPWAAGGPPTLREVDPNRQPYIGRGRPFGGIHQVDGSGPQQTLVVVLFADRSVRNLVQGINPRIFEAMTTYAGNDEVLEDP